MQPNFYSVNLDVVLKEADVPDSVKSAIYQSKTEGHVTLEQFLRTISTKSLTELQGIFDAAIDKNENAFRNALVCTLALAAIDGLYVESYEDATEYLKTLFLCVNMESLYRKGFIELDRKELTFLYNPNAVIAKPTAKRSRNRQQSKGKSRMFKSYEKPNCSYFGKHPRSLSEAFRSTAEYGAAIEVPYTNKRALGAFLAAIPKVIWWLGVLALVGIIVSI